MPATRNVLVITDNVFLARSFWEIARELDLAKICSVDYVCSPDSPCLGADLPMRPTPLKIGDSPEELANHYQLIISAHGKQLFPAELVRRVLCINVHPGFNPHNRGWYPQVFSIVNGRPLGATLHVIDEQLDHGPIVAREEVPLHGWDTSLTAYNRVLEAERRLLRSHLPAIIAGTFSTTRPETEGNLNLRKDFVALCRLDLEETGTMREHLDRLRALTHGDYANAYFIDPVTGQKVFVRVSLTPELKP